MKLRQRTRGFTLVELLVVIGIFGFVSVMAYGGLNSVLKSRTAIKESLQRTAEIQKAYQRLRNDFQQVRNRPVRDGFGDAQPAVLGLAVPSVEFTRGGWRNPLSLPRPSLERVSYQVKEGVLLRASFRVLDQSQDAKPVELKLLTKVNEFRLRYLNDAREWQDTWPPLSATGAKVNADAPAPRAIEVTLVTSAEGELQFVFRTGADALPAGFVRGSSFGSSSGGTTTTPITPPPDEEQAPSEQEQP